MTSEILPLAPGGTTPSGRRSWPTETFLAHLETSAATALIPAAVYLEAALLELSTGPQVPGSHDRRVATGLMLDAQHAAREARGLLDGWSGTDPLRRAVVEALDNFESASAHLAAVLDKQGNR